MHIKIASAFYIAVWTVLVFSAVVLTEFDLSKAQKVHFCLEEAFNLYTTYNNASKCGQLNHSKIDLFGKKCSDVCSIVNPVNCSKGTEKEHLVLNITTKNSKAIIGDAGNSLQTILRITCNVSLLLWPADEYATNSFETLRTTTVYSSEVLHMTFHTTISSFETSQINPDMMLSPSANLQPTSDLTVFPISVHTAPYRTSSDVQNTTLYMTISSSATLHTSPDLTISSASPQANTTLSSTAVQFTTPDLTISTHCGYAKSIEASYGSSVGAAFAGLIFGIIVTSAVCVVQHRMHWRAKKENITAVSQVMYEMDSVQNQPVSTRQNVQKTDIYNEISDENHKSRILQVMPIVRGIGQSSLDSNKCGVYNHLHEESPVNNDNGNYDHAHFSGNEQDADPNHYGKLDREEITGNYSVLQRERFDVVDNTENKSRENYFVLEKN